MNAVTEVISQTNWELLRSQKAEVVNLLYDLAAQEREGNAPHLTCRLADNLEGLLNWIDAIQDAAVSDGHVEADQVFGWSDCDV